MHLDNSIILAITLNIALILTVSWLGIKIINTNLYSRFDNNKDTPQVSKIVKETSVIIPRIKTSFRIRRMIKPNLDNDETPYFMPQLT
ncbi:MAG TPA: hypothetical protein VN426_06430 [Syntrophomonadaceae bacterium]|nr:hypothetical protein [Syntrophomonadaceae bacterium]